MLAISATALAADPCQPVFDSGSNAQVRECLGAELQKADKELNETYRATMAGLSSSGREALKIQERQWIKFRDKQCRVDEDGGTEAYVIADGCLVDETNKRIKAIEAFKHD